jgi:thiol-disulfide isomerase/thioredoxin
MQKRVFFIILLAFFALNSMAEGVKYLSTADFKAKVCFYDLSTQQAPRWKYIGDKPCLIDFSTTWCGWCKKLHPVLEQLAKEYEGEIYVYTLDAEREREVAALFGVSSFPTVVLCPMEGGPQITKGYHELDYWQEAIKQIFGIEPKAQP